MSIYYWDNGWRVDTRKGEALIYPPEGADASAAEALRNELTRQGYALSPARIPQGEEHTLSIAGFKDAQDAGKLVTMLRKFEKKYDITVTHENNRITINGLTHPAYAESILRWASARGYKPEDGYQYEHKHVEHEPKVGMYIHEVKDENRLLSTLEKDWARGERKDEYHGMSPLKKSWSKMVKSARKFSSFLFGLGDLQVLYSTKLDTDRRDDIDHLWEHPAFSEGAGMAIGSQSIFASEILSEPPGVTGVVNRFKDNFRVGGHLDFEGKSEGFAPQGVSLGRGVDQARNFVRENGMEIKLLADLWSSKGFWDGRYSRVIATTDPSKDEHKLRNVKLDAETGDVEFTGRLKKNDRNSAFLYSSAAAIAAFVPQEGAERDPFVNYNSIGDRLGNIPVLGHIFRALGAFKSSVLDPTILRPVNWLMEKVSNDPFKVAGRIFIAHNLNQVYYGIQRVRELGQEIEAMEEQFVSEKKNFEQTGTPPSASMDLSVTGEDVKDALAIIYDMDNDKGYKQFIKTYEEKQKAVNTLPTDVETYLMVKAMNRRYLEELKAEKKIATVKFGGYFTFLSANTMLSFAGEGHQDLVNMADKMVNPFAAAHGIADTLQEEGATSPAAIHNAATYLHQDTSLMEYGFSITMYEEIIQAKLEGRPSAMEQAIWNQSPWAGTTPAQPDNVAHSSKQEATYEPALTTQANIPSPEDLELLQGARLNGEQMERLAPSTAVMQ